MKRHVAVFQPPKTHGKRTLSLATPRVLRGNPSFCHGSWGLGLEIIHLGVRNPSGKPKCSSQKERCKSCETQNGANEGLQAMVLGGPKQGEEGQSPMKLTISGLITSRLKSLKWYSEQLAYSLRTQLTGTGAHIWRFPLPHSQEMGRPQLGRVLVLSDYYSP